MSVISKGADKIFTVFRKEGAEAYLVGGTVRNHLWGLPINDRDFAVSCPPDETLRICEKHGLKTIPTGIDHGTITILAEDEAFEATSFRKDVQTDGRHAVTEFGGSIEEDALRRDFTINAIYLNHKGNIIDPLGGLPDIENKQLKFVGNADERIKEDYLRILRFFRFYSQYDLSADAVSLHAIKKFNEGLEYISAERVGSEMRKLFAGDHFVNALEKIELTQTSIRISYNLDAAKAWFAFEKRHSIKPDWTQRIAAISSDIPKDEWRLFNAEINYMRRLYEARHDSNPPQVMGYLYGELLARQAIELRAFKSKIMPFDYISAIKFGDAQIFPISGKDLLPFVAQGKALGELLKMLETEWYCNNFALDRDALLELAKNGYAKLES